MSRRSVLSRRARGGEPELPLRVYFLSVGGALLLLLLAADWVLPAPSPSRLTDSHSALPPIRIHSDRRGPEAAVIDTSGFGPHPAPAEHDIAQAQLPETEVGDAIVHDDDGNPAVAAADPRLRESLAQLQPAVHDQAGRRSPHEIAARRRKLAPARKTPNRPE
ncbi:hypothetical protein [Bradyrhizobium sp. cf659]|uniref:hypothetical protein n=1 Tax=Bradyrhizobium sp. cf659 TaxID=1761771 RepID=UPI0008F309D0|nr:hypothetical protein [Bradyrhizobium sp. cf659]SFI73844.1 hypothetical protein SAMN04487925_103894 [Bradyrhizobium sp. cf659]